MFIWIVVGILVAGLAAKPADTSKPKIEAVFQPHFAQSAEPSNMQMPEGYEYTQK